MPVRLTQFRHCIASNDNCPGFTLIEILVAVSVLAITLVVIMQLFAGGLRAGKLSDDHTRAVFHASYIMDGILMEDQLVEGLAEGDFDGGYRWKSEITLEEVTKAVWSIPSFSVYSIKVAVSWGGVNGKTLDLQTTKITETREETTE